jgi:predicted PhzF superfamily epimerase YddE/YHI9
VNVYVVDAFTSRPFRGNPAAVVPLESPRDGAWMQSVAAEMRHSETAFPLRAGESWKLRWFTPAVEVDLCGHATLAAAHVLWEAGLAPRDRELLFDTRSGRVAAFSRGDRIEMIFPSWPAPATPAPPGLMEALGARPLFCGASHGNWLVQLSDEAAVRAVRPDFAALGRNGWSVIVTALSASPEFDFVSRYFAVPYGIDEDPVTGSSHCTLAPHWAGILGRSRLVGFQASARGGVVAVESAGERVLISGQAVSVLSGRLLGAVVAEALSGPGSTG